MLERLQPCSGARHRRKRVGRGPGSGHRKTSGRGIKGQGKRSAGNETNRHFEGGQMPLARRLPKRGFTNPSRETVEIVNVGVLRGFEAGARIDAQALFARGLVRGSGEPIKLLGNGDAPQGVTVVVQRVSESARRKIEEAGGKVEIVA
ncbi:MAG: 50S ribosomal protein L15 [Deltaproteobacteria bacterium]|nr:50S ribosomal protein L15 [Deltaproteobacteria bacterium]